jgi:hypothetical protein
VSALAAVSAALVAALSLAWPSPAPASLLLVLGAALVEALSSQALVPSNAARAKGRVREVR